MIHQQDYFTENNLLDRLDWLSVTLSLSIHKCLLHIDHNKLMTLMKCQLARCFFVALLINGKNVFQERHQPQTRLSI